MSSNQHNIARAIAVIAHRGQTDKAGKPYIGHPERVVKRLEPDAANDSHVLAAAWLHDVLEDTGITADDLAAAGINDLVITAVIALTRLDGEQPETYYARVYGDWIATRVKLADIEDNLDPARLSLLEDATIARLTRKYAKARKALGVTS